VDIDDDTEETFVPGREEIEARLIPWAVIIGSVAP
jgi:hypothetical protein